MGHEFGHFLIAKVNGIRVNEFAIGMGPKIAGFKKGETEYVLRAFPLGGACIFEGEDGLEAAKEEASAAGTPADKTGRGALQNVPVDVVIRPEDLYIFPVSDMAQLRGTVQSCIFKGVHYEMVVLCHGYEFVVQDYHAFEAGTEVGMLVKPFDIHIMKKERICNTFEGKLIDETHVEFLGCEFECAPVDLQRVPLGDVLVDVDFGKINLLDNAEDGMLTGEVKFILYKGNHYHLTVWSDWDENVFVDTNDVWDDGDRVGISIAPEDIRVRVKQEER